MIPAGKFLRVAVLGAALSAITVAAALAIPVAMDRYNQKKSYSEDDLYADEHRRRAAAKESTGGDRK